MTIVKDAERGRRMGRARRGGGGDRFSPPQAVSLLLRSDGECLHVM